MPIVVNEQRARRIFFFLVGPFLTGALSATLHAAEPLGVTLALGKGLDDTLIQSGSIANAESLGLSVDAPSDLHRSALLAPFGIDDSRVELHLARLQGPYKGRDEHLGVLALTPVFHWQFSAAPAIGWEAGLGVAQISDNQFQAVVMRGRSLFNMQGALLWSPSADWSLALCYRHYSNGYTRRPNPGLDQAELAFRWQF